MKYDLDSFLVKISPSDGDIIISAYEIGGNERIQLYKGKENVLDREFDLCEEWRLIATSIVKRRIDSRFEKENQLNRIEKKLDELIREKNYQRNKEILKSNLSK